VEFVFVLGSDPCIDTHFKQACLRSLHTSDEAQSTSSRIHKKGQFR
jgi:hypothetical protein